MPSIGHRPLKFKNRYMILNELRRKNQRRQTLATIFDSTIGKILPTKRQVPKIEYAEMAFKYQTPKRQQLRFNQLLYELKRDKLIVEGSRQNALMKITTRGLLWLKKFKENPPLKLPCYAERAEKNNRVIIVSYDIPNKLTSLRNWLRKNLLTLGMTAMQHSVFIGKIKLPADLLQSILQLKLEKYIEIFEITKAGTLRQHSK